MDDGRWEMENRLWNFHNRQPLESEAETRAWGDGETRRRGDVQREERNGSIGIRGRNGSKMLPLCTLNYLRSPRSLGNSSSPRSLRSPNPLRTLATDQNLFCKFLGNRLQVVVMPVKVANPHGERSQLDNQILHFRLG